MKISQISREWWDSESNQAQYESVDSPDEKEVAKAVKFLKSESGGVTLNTCDESGTQVGYILIQGMAGKYFLVQSEHNNDQFLLVDTQKDVPKSPVDETLDILGNECLEHNTVNDLDAIMKSVKSFLKSGAFKDFDSYSWIEVNKGTNAHRFNY